MGASIVIYWPGITEEQMGADIGFQNDDRAWANWNVEIASDQRLQSLMRVLGIDALWSHTTDGVADKDVRWVSPDQFCDAAWSMIRLIESSDPRIKPLLTSYKKGGNGLQPVEEELGTDLSDIILRAQHAKDEGVPLMTLSINW